MTDIVDTVSQAIMDVADTQPDGVITINAGGTPADLRELSTAILARLETEGATLLRDDWRQHMQSLLGRIVDVTIGRWPSLTVVRGQLLSFDEGGTVALRHDDGFIRWAWPNLSTDAVNPQPHATEPNRGMAQ